MQRIFRHFFFVLAFFLTAGTVVAQTTKWRDMHKVKKKETLYSICRDYGLTLDELKKANPEMLAPDYKLKKGDVVFIPFPVNEKTEPTVTTTSAGGSSISAPSRSDVRTRAIRLGIMLPLHDINGDGKRMVEYYRGVLMACDSLKKEGISVDVYAWNVPENGDIKAALADPNAALCDIIIGPLYSKYVSALSTFVEQNNIMLVIPFSINAPELYGNRHIFQIYQHPGELTESTSRRFSEWFRDYHPIIVDCGDASSTKGDFTASMRRHLEARNIAYSLTSLSSTDENFRKAFDASKQNVVVLNTARFADMNALFGKLSDVSSHEPDTKISVFGYTEWLTQASRQLDNFYRYNVYVPSHFYTSLSSPATISLTRKYRQNFHQDMMQLHPRFALTGFDHAYFFLKGLHKYGNTFDGAAGRFGYPPVQTPLKFERIGNGGLQNRSFMFIHYKPDHQVELINY